MLTAACASRSNRLVQLGQVDRFRALATIPMALSLWPIDLKALARGHWRETNFPVPG